jgi:hypothetical protein
MFGRTLSTGNLARKRPLARGMSLLGSSGTFSLFYKENRDARSYFTKVENQVYPPI